MRRFTLHVATIMLLSSALGAVCSEPVTTTTPLHPPFKKLWTFTPKGDDSSISSSVIAGDTMCYTAGGSYGAVDLLSGKPLWQKTFKNDFHGASVATDGKALYVALRTSRLMACNPRTGREMWSVPCKASFTEVTVSHGMLYYQTKDGFLTALSLKSRKPVWTTPLETLKPRETPTAYTSCQPLATDTRVFVGVSSGDVFCLTASSGKPVWRYRVQGRENYATGFAFDGRQLFCSTRDDQIIGILMANGKKGWAFDPGSEYAAGNRPLLFHGAVMMSGAGQLYALDPKTGKPGWFRNLSPDDSVSQSPATQVSGCIVVSVESKLVCFGTTGEQLWEWDTKEDLRGDPVALAKDGLVLTSVDGICRFAMGQGASLPVSAEARLQLASKLTERFDVLSKDEKKTLVNLGDESFVVLLPLAKERLTKYEAEAARSQAGAIDANYKLYERFSDVADLLCRTAGPRRTPEMLGLFNSAGNDNAKNMIGRWLVEKGDEQQTIPIFLDILGRATWNPDEENLTEAVALAAVAKSADSSATKFMMDQLANPKSNVAIRRAALDNLSRTGGAAGAEAVIAALDTGRTISTISDFMHLDALSPVLKDPKAEFEWPWSYQCKLTETRKDAKGLLWGLLSSRAAGGSSDLWVSSYNSGKWSEPVYTGVAGKELGNADWLARFAGDATIAADSDADGWSDLMERRLGTNPNNPDSDGDGLKDSQDKNPLAAPRELTETEQVMASAFQARFQFGGGRDAVCLVRLPKNIQPFELCGWDWIVIPEKNGAKSPLDDLSMKGIASVRFMMPRMDFAGASVRNRSGDEIVLWNSDHTEAKVEVDVTYGGLDGTGFEVTLKKFGDKWLVVNLQMAWIS
jgi:outer membrane protein assembly factor BamB